MGRKNRRTTIDEKTARDDKYTMENKEFSSSSTDMECSGSEDYGFDYYNYASQFEACLHEMRDYLVSVGVTLKDLTYEAQCDYSGLELMQLGVAVPRSLFLKICDEVDGYGYPDFNMLNGGGQARCSIMPARFGCFVGGWDEEPCEAERTDSHAKKRIELDVLRNKTVIKKRGPSATVAMKNRFSALTKKKTQL